MGHGGDWKESLCVITMLFMAVRVERNKQVRELLKR